MNGNYSHNIDFEVPPVIEVVIGVQFDPLPLRTADFGLFAELIKDLYPDSEDHPPLPPSRIPGKANASINWELLELPPLRRVFFTNSEGWVLQLQADKFIHNWQKINDVSQYPHFEKCYAMFGAAWRRFAEFCKSRGYAVPSPTMYELIYINHIPSGSAWNSLNEIGNVFPHLTWPSMGLDECRLRDLSWRASLAFDVPPSVVDVVVRKATRQTDGSEVLLCEFSACGAPATPSAFGVTQDKWFELSRKNIVQMFRSLASESAQQTAWRRK